MTSYFGVDHRLVAAGGVALACGLTAIGTYKLVHGSGGHGHGHGKGHAHGPGVSFGGKKDMFFNFHYATPESLRVFDCIPIEDLDAPTRIVNMCIKHWSQQKQAGKDIPSRAIDVGCNVGGFSFRLAKGFNEVVGIDMNQDSLDIAQHMKEKGGREYTIEVEGEIKKKVMGVVPKEIDRSRVTFMQADACNPPPNLGQFGCVLICNVLHHVEKPRVFLHGLRDLLVPGGIFVMVEQFRWNYGDAKREDWIGGQYIDGEPVMSWPTLQKELSNDFELLEHCDTNLIAPECYRIYLHMVVKVSAWRRK
ncbi:hypothetical protein ScPMuIL_013827 [Solemya velum]